MAILHRIISLMMLSILLLGCMSDQTKLQDGMKCYKAQTYHSAFIKLRPLADKGVPEAQYAIGVMYYYGKGVNENRKKAIYWFKCAAKQGHQGAIKALNLLKENHQIQDSQNRFF